MKKTETLRQLAASANAKSISELGMRIEALRQAKIESADQLAEMLEPIAQAMAALTYETRSTLLEIGQKSREHSHRFEQEVATAATAVQRAAMMAERASDQMNRAGHNLQWTHYLLSAAIGLLAAGLVSAFWLWREPPLVTYQMDAAQVAEQLRPAIEALKPPRRK